MRMRFQAMACPTEVRSLVGVKENISNQPNHTQTNLKRE